MIRAETNETQKFQHSYGYFPLRPSRDGFRDSAFLTSQWNEKEGLVLLWRLGFHAVRDDD